MRKKILVKGAIIVLIASVVTRILGFFFRVFLADKLGAQGMGVYQLILSLYLLVVTLATSGVSFSVSRLVAENMATSKNNNSKYILKTAILWAIFLSAIVSFIMVFFRNYIGANILRDERTTLSILWLAPSLPFIAISSCIKGYFFAKRKPLYPSTASIIEQIIKMIIITIMLDISLNTTISTSCAIISIGMTISEVISAIYMAFLYFKGNNGVKYETVERRKTLSNILKVSIPVQTSTTFNSALKLIESILIIESLKIFTKGDVQAATSSYGIIKGMVFPLILFPTSFLQAIITVLIPELSGATAGGNKRAIKKACEKSLQLTLILGIFVAAIFIMFPNKIASMFYKNPEVGPMLKILSTLCPIMYVQLICMGILNSIGEQVASMKYNFLDGILKVALIAILVPKGGINAFLFLTFACNIFILFLYAFKLAKSTSFPICISDILIKPIFSIVVACFISLPLTTKLENMMPNWALVSLISFVIFLVYAIMLLNLGCVKINKYITIFNKNR